MKATKEHCGPAPCRQPLTQNDLDEIAVFTYRLAEGALAAAKMQPSRPLTPEIARRRRAFVEDVRHAGKRIVEIKRADPRRLAAAIARLKAKDQYGEHAETGVLAA